MSEIAKGLMIAAIITVIIYLGYLFFLAVGMSSTHPSIKVYSFEPDEISIEKKLDIKLSSLEGWSLKMGDSTQSESEACFTVELFNYGNGMDIEYDIKYCFEINKIGRPISCVRLEIIGAFDYIAKTGGYKSTDRDVEKLVAKLEYDLLNDLADECK